LACGRLGCIADFFLDLNNESANLAGGTSKWGATVEHFLDLRARTLVDGTSHFASFYVEFPMPANEGNKGGFATQLRVTRTMQPLAKLATVIPANGFGIDLLIAVGTGSPVCSMPA
jgi:hypothetical protein